MPRLISAAFIAALFLGADIQCQTQNRIFLYDGNATSGRANTFPWSREQLRYQTIFPGAKFGNKPCLVNDILVAPQLAISPSIKTAVYADIEIRMGATAQASPTTSWSANNPKPTVVYRGPMRVTFEKGVWRGMGLPRPYVFIPTSSAGNLCVEFIMWKFDPNFFNQTTSIRAVTAPTSVLRAFYYQWTISQSTPPTVGSGAARMGLVCNNGNFVVTEQGCNSSNNTTLAISADTFPKANSPIAISLTGGKPATSALLVVGSSDTKWPGGALPYDAGILGAPGCFIWNDWLAFVGTSTDSSGMATLKFTVPSISGAPRSYVHWWNLDKAANALGVTSSNYAKILLGN